MQRPARLPDDGEWTCVDSAGVVVCVGGEPAAGVVAGPPDPAWRCNARVAAAHDDLGARICVDGAPDFPDADRARWRCRIENGPSPKRVCEHATAASIWNPCDRAHPCVDGATCTDAHCVVPSTTPSCWLDTDCPSHACRFGTCRPEGAP
ncbi:MAG TPA: hypothetical protein VHJ20_01440 [Polyangia bacterium]|nr:hypothetical protein [Polyangia bacterium]